MDNGESAEACWNPRAVAQPAASQAAELLCRSQGGECVSSVNSTACTRYYISERIYIFLSVPTTMNGRRETPRLEQVLYHILRKGKEIGGERKARNKILY